MNTSDLQRALHADAELAGPPPTDLIDRVDHLGRTRRRQRAAVLATAVAAALIAVGVPTTAVLINGSDRNSTAGPNAVQIYGGPTRGSLAENTALVTAVSELPWPATAADGATGLAVNPPTGSRTVEFLGDVAGTRYALVTGGVSGDLYAAWFTAPLGGDASAFVAAGSPKSITRTEPLAFADTTVDFPVVLVVAGPSDRIDFSDRAVLAADGTITRAYTTGEDLGDGVAVMPTTQAAVSAVSFRVTRDGIVAYRSRPDTNGNSRPTDPSDRAAQIADPRGVAGIIDPALMADALADIATPLQLPLAELQPTLLWAGPIPGPEDHTSTAVVVGITAPSGASIVSGMAYSGPGDGSYGIYNSGWQTYDSRHPLLDQAQLLRNSVSDGTASGQPVSSLLLLNPVSATSTLQAVLNPPDADVTEATNGVLLLPGDTNTTNAVLVDVTTGQPLVEAQLMPSDYADHYDYGSGPA